MLSSKPWALSSLKPGSVSRGTPCRPLARSLPAPGLLRRIRPVCVSSDEAGKQTQTESEASTYSFDTTSSSVSSGSASAPVPAPAAAPAAAASEAQPEPGPDQSTAGASPKSYPLNDFFGTEELVTELTESSPGHRGEVLLLAQIITMLLIVLPPIKLQGLVHLVGILLLSTGAVFLLYSLVCLGRNISPMSTPRKVHKLVTTGVYGLVRHPMYTGLLFSSFGLSVVTLSETRLALSLLLWFVLELKSGFEEKALTSIYPEYSEYKKRVKKFIPFVY